VSVQHVLSLASSSQLSAVSSLCPPPPMFSRSHSTLCVGQVRVKKDAGCRHHQAGDVQSPPMSLCLSLQREKDAPALAPSTSRTRPLDVNGIVVACAFQESDGPWPSPPFRDFYGRTPVLPPAPMPDARRPRRRAGGRKALMPSRCRAPSHTWRAPGPCAPP